jgi:hypothetical protein
MACEASQLQEEQRPGPLRSLGDAALLRPRRLCRVEPPVALFNAASPLVPGNGGADMVRAGALACSGDFLLCLAGCEGKDLIAERARRPRWSKQGRSASKRRGPQIARAAMAAGVDERDALLRIFNRAAAQFSPSRNSGPL